MYLPGIRNPPAPGCAAHPGMKSLAEQLLARLGLVPVHRFRLSGYNRLYVHHWLTPPTKGPSRDTSGHRRQRLEHPPHPDHQRHARHHHGDERRVDPRAERRGGPPVGRARHVHARPVDSGGAPGHRIGRPHAGRHRHGRLRDDDAGPLHAGQRLPAAGGARPAEACPASTSASSAAGSSTGCSWPTRTCGPGSRSTSCSSAPRCTRRSCRSARRAGRAWPGPSTRRSPRTSGTSTRRTATSRCSSATARPRWLSRRSTARAAA